jgi:CDP-diacylglycerol--glycerol-3-phosphate 3-phosphatidyltransferase
MPEITLDLIYALALLSVALIVGIIYGLRVLIRGRADFERVNQHGGSVLLGKGVMQGAYWSLQPLARFLIFLKISPNQITVVSVAFAMASGVCLAFGHFGSGAVFATVAAFLDTLDGMVARLTGSASKAGAVLDSSMDRYAEFFFLGGLAVYYRSIPVLLILTLLAVLGSFMVSYSTAKADEFQVSAPKSSMRRPERAVYLTLGALFSPITISIFEQVRPYGMALGHPMVIALGLVAVVSNIYAIERLLGIAQELNRREAESCSVASRLKSSEASPLSESGDSNRAPAKIH